MKLVIRVLTFSIFLSINSEAFAQLSSFEVPDFTLINVVTNQPVSLNDYKSSNAIVIIFTSNTCPYSKLYEDRILGLSNEYADKDVTFLLINSNSSSLSDVDNIPRMKIKANEKNYPFPYLADKEGLARKIFQSSKNPEAFVLSKNNGVLTTLYQGAIDDNPQVSDAVQNNYIAMALNNILDGKPSPIQYKRPIGCRIKTD